MITDRGLTNRISMSPQVMFVFFSFFASITLSAGILFEYIQGDLIWHGIKGWAVIGYCIIFPSILAQIFFMRGVELIGATHVAAGRRRS